MGLTNRCHLHAALSSAVAAVLAVSAGVADASSHREAPFIAGQPKVDATDFYMFNSYETGRAGYVTLVADYIPLEDPYGGPNYFKLDSNALYEILIDNVGDAHEHLTFQFRFKTVVNDTALNIGGQQIDIPLVQSGPIAAGNNANQNVAETYTVDIVRGDRRTGSHQAITNAANGAAVFTKPTDFIGTKTFGSVAGYAAYAAQYVYNINIPGCSGTGRMFVGQRKDPFVVALGQTFDLINLNPLGPNNANPDSLATKNVTALELEVPASCLVAGDPVIGGWTAASLRQVQVQSPVPEEGWAAGAQLVGGAWTQVSRLGMPLVNEVVIGLPDKDRFNASEPKDDAQFAKYVTNPTLPALIQALFSAPAPTNFPRTDLVTAFLTGVNGLNEPKHVTPAEMLRLNTTTPAVAKGAQNNLGVIGGDAAGYPNGRRPGDDVVDISLRVVMGVLCTLNDKPVFGCVSTDAPAGSAPLTDGAYVDSTFFDAAFPYLITPLPGAN